jgi:ABC-type multidrug transport system fused ATPase/permease subunit
MGLAISASLFLGFRAYLLVMSGIKQGRLIHKKMAKSLLYASLTKFYNRVPVGRILNRLSKDLREIDESVGYAFSYVLVAFFSLCGNLFICIYASTPYVIIPIVFVAFVCYKLQRYYLKTQRETTRLEKVTTSPIVSGFTSTINGVGTIRAYEMEHEFLAEQIDKVELNKRMRISKEALEAWFSMRLSMFTFFINMTAIGYAILSDSKNASVIGLLLTYAMNLNGDIVDTIFSFANLETVMISVERAMSFIKIEP